MLVPHISLLSALFDVLQVAMSPFVLLVGAFGTAFCMFFTEWVFGKVVMKSIANATKGRGSALDFLALVMRG